MPADNNIFSIKRRFKSVGYAIAGLVAMVKTQHNAWIHLLATIGVITVGFIVGVTAAQWCLLIIAIISVWAAEALNTAFEALCDVASPEYHPQVKRAKDIAAGAVLLAAIGAAVIGCVILGPYLLQCFN
jgi:diacylglycerol kinase (ATP)